MVTQPAHHARAIKAILPTSPLVTSPQPHAASQPCRRALIQDSCPVAVAGIWIWTSIICAPGSVNLIIWAHSDLKHGV